MHQEWISILIAVAALAFGGILKGATGAGAPIVAVPVMAMLYDVPLAVAIFVVPNFLSNVWQGWQYRGAQLSKGFVYGFAGSGIAGVALGTVILTRFSSDTLMLLVAGVVYLYVAFRIARPGWQLARARAGQMVLPSGFAAGVLQGAAGISAPVSVTFLNAMRLERAQFIATISVFFAAMSGVQFAMLWGFGVMTPLRMALSLAALVPIVALMPAGAALARRMSPAAFDKLVLALLLVVALRLTFVALG